MVGYVRLSLYAAVFLLLAEICSAFCTNTHGLSGRACSRPPGLYDFPPSKSRFTDIFPRRPAVSVIALQSVPDNEASNSPTEISSKWTFAGWSLRLMASAMVWLALQDSRSISTAVRLTTAAITCLDFAPTIDTQWQNIARGLETNKGKAKEVGKFRNAVCFKGLGELLGLGMMIARAHWACLGATIILLSHVLFWAVGGGSSRIDANGNHVPASPALVKVICTADLIVATTAALGTFAPTRRLRSVGAIAYSLLTTMLVAEKAKKHLEVSKEGPQVYTSTNKTLEVVDEKKSGGIEEKEIHSTNESISSPWNYDWNSQWYPLAFSKVTSKKVPHRLELFGEHLVLWHNGTDWAALADVCPHRLAPLSEGRVDETGQIECPYHGWTFTKEGTCTKIPQSTSCTNLRGCGARSYRVVERQGIIFVWGKAGATAEEADESLVPICPALDDDRFVWIDFSRDLPYSADILMENVLDSSHVCFTHHQTISKRENAIPLPLKLTTPIEPAGFHGEMAGDVAIGKTGEENIKAKRVTQRKTDFVAPAYMNHIIRSADVDSMDFDAGFETWTVAYATPTGPGRSRLLARFPFRFPPPKRRFFRFNVPGFIFKYLPDWINHLGQLKVTDDDNIFLPIQERQVHDMGGWKRYKMPTDADAFVKGYRRWYDKAGVPPHSPFAIDEYRSSEPTKEKLLDRKSQHTDHCASCNGARKNAIRIQSIMRGALLVCVAFTPTVVAQKSWKAFSTLGLITFVVLQIKRAAYLVEESLTTGMANYPPPRNRPAGRRLRRELRTVEQGRQG